MWRLMNKNIGKFMKFSQIAQLIIRFCIKPTFFENFAQFGEAAPSEMRSRHKYEIFIIN